MAEEADIRLHPDDPAMPRLRDTARLVYQPDLYQKLLDIVPSYANALEFCQGSIAEMIEGDVYEAIDRYSKQGKIAYVHFRNVRGKVPEYQEVFLDEGDVDMIRVLQLYKQSQFDGMMIPDHGAAQVMCRTVACGDDLRPWLYACGYHNGPCAIIVNGGTCG